jgi:zinc/manganese transport system substrate-binding protein
MRIKSNAVFALMVLTTTPDLAWITAQVGGASVEVKSLAKGTQDPHFLEAKPSFMSMAMKADLVVYNGLDLEVGYLPLIIQGARNPKIRPGEKGNLDASRFIEPIEIPQGAVTRAEGDVHPDGNPHYLLDPVRAGKVAVGIAGRLGELVPEKAAEFRTRALEMEKDLAAKTAAWKKRIEASGVKSVVTYHKTLNYFLNRFGITPVATLEPKPGIPPTSGHLLEVIESMKTQGAKVILVENYFDESITRKILPEVPGSRTSVVAVAVGGSPSVNSLPDVYEKLVKAMEGAK